MPSVWIPSLLRPLAGGRETVAVPGATVREVVDNLDAMFPGIKAQLCNGDRLRPEMSVAIDGVLGSRGLRDRVAETSEIHFVPAIGGGAPGMAAQARADVDSAGAHTIAPSPLFAGLSPADMDGIIGAAQRRRVAQGAFFFLQGDAAQAMYVLQEGQVKLTQVTPEGQQVIIRYVAPGDLFAVGAALEVDEYPASAEAVKDSVAWVWDGETVAHLLEQHPRLAVNALKLLAARVRELQDRLRELATERVERRIARTLLRLVRQSGKRVEGGVLIGLPLSRQDLAEMSGTTLHTVSRVLSRWEQDGLIAGGRERVLIRSPHGLVTIAEDLPPPNRPAR